MRLGPDVHRHRKDQAPQIRSLLPDLPTEHLLVEPLGKNTAPCVGLAALVLADRDPEAVMVILPADLYIAQVPVFQQTLSAAVDAARSGEYLITLGITPLFPETGYGYIEKGEELSFLQDQPVWRVKAFHEKPDRVKAEAMVAAGSYYWNSGMFVWTVSAILKKMALYAGPLWGADGPAAPDRASRLG